MKCPTGISFDMLLDLVDGKADERQADLLNAHLRSGCQSCVETHDWLQTVIRLMSTDPLIMTSPESKASSHSCGVTFQQLVDFADGSLPLAPRRQVAAHLGAGCQACNANVEWLERSLGLMAQNQIIAAPAAVVQRAIDLFAEQRASAPTQAPGILQRLVATLRADSQSLQPLPVRGAGLSARQQLFQANDWEIDIHIRADRDGCRLAGQVLCSAAPAHAARDLSVVLTQGGNRVASTVTEATGDFDLAGLAPGQYDLTIRTAREEIWVKDLEI